MSVPPPGAAGTTKRSAWVGFHVAWARAIAGRASKGAAANRLRRRRGKRLSMRSSRQRDAARLYGRLTDAGDDGRDIRARRSNHGSATANPLAVGPSLPYIVDRWR